MNFHRWWPLVSVLVPHSRISFDWANVSGSMPPAVPLCTRQPGVAGHRADVQVVPRGAEHVPEPPAGEALEALDVAERAGALERPDRLAAVLVDDPAQPCGDLLQRLVPADPLEPALALAARRAASGAGCGPAPACARGSG